MQAHNTIATEDTGQSAIAHSVDAKQGRTATPADQRATQQSGISVEFLSNLAHQLRSPLSSLRVWVDLLGDPAALASHGDTKRLVDGIQRATARLERQISDVLEVGYLQAGSLSFELGPVDTSEQVIRAVSDVEHAAKSRRIEIAIELNDQPISVLSSETRFRQILECLLSNAIRFSPAGGVVKVRAAAKPKIAADPDTTVILQPDSVSEEARLHYIAVSDDGPGIPVEKHMEIFKPFQRAVRKDAHGGGGSGLGLAIVHGLVSLHHGGLWVRSRPDHGAEFEFALPVEASIPSRTNLN